MKTVQIIKRKFYQTEISQRSDNGYLNATELLKYYNKDIKTKKSIDDFWANKNTQDYLVSLAKRLNLNTQNSGYLTKDLYSTVRGKHGGTIMHPYLFVKFAMWLSTDFEVQVISWVYDNVIAYRNQAGDHYKEMCSTIQNVFFNYYGRLPDPLIFQQEARFINHLVFGKTTDIDRNEATEKQLDLLNKLQLANIKLLKSKVKKEDRQTQLSNFATLYI